MYTKLSKYTILNRKLNSWISQLGHYQKLMIVDAGMPLDWNQEANILDLSLSPSTNAFLKTLEIVINNLKIEQFIIAQESEVTLVKAIKELFNKSPNQKANCLFRAHDDLKKIVLEKNTLIIRTSQTSPYQNIVLVAGVSF